MITTKTPPAPGKPRALQMMFKVCRMSVGLVGHWEGSVGKGAPP